MWHSHCVPIKSHCSDWSDDEKMLRSRDPSIHIQTGWSGRCKHTYTQTVSEAFEYKKAFRLSVYRGNILTDLIHKTAKILDFFLDCAFLNPYFARIRLRIHMCTLQSLEHSKTFTRRDATLAQVSVPCSKVTRRVTEWSPLLLRCFWDQEKLQAKEIKSDPRQWICKIHYHSNWLMFEISHPVWDELCHMKQMESKSNNGSIFCFK